jgi:hypothetical protein
LPRFWGACLSSDVVAEIVRSHSLDPKALALALKAEHLKSKVSACSTPFAVSDASVDHCPADTLRVLRREMQRETVSGRARHAVVATSKGL